MSHACIALLLATTLAAPAAEPVVAPVAEPVAAPAPVVSPAPAPVVSPAPAPVVSPAPAPTIELAPTVAPAPAIEPAPVVILAPAPAPSVPPAAAPPPPRIDPEHARAQRTADGLVITGAAIAGLGGATLLLVAAPSQALYRRSLDRAESVRWVTEQDRFIDDAQRRRSIMLVSAGIGAGLTVIGTVILATGLARRARLRSSPVATLSVAPAVGGGSYGVGASMRF
jgi:hypothetical protein